MTEQTQALEPGRQLDVERMRGDEDREKTTAALQALAEELEDSAVAAHRDAAHIAELDSIRAELNRQREALEAERHQAARNLEQDRAALEKMRVELEAHQRDLQSAQRLLQEQLAQTAAGNPRQDDSDDTEDTLAPGRTVEIKPIEMLDDVRDDEDEQEEEESTSHLRRRRSDPRDPDSGEHEQSVEQYMANLLNRMRGGSSAEGATQPQSKSPRKPAASAPAAPAQSEAAPRDVSSAHAGQTAPAAMARAPRCQPAEVTGLSAMRELANIQARSAINAHGKKRLTKAAVMSLCASLACVAGTVVLLLLIPADDQGLRTGSMVGIVAGIYWMFRAMLATQQLLVAEHRHRRATAQVKAKCCAAPVSEASEG